MSFYDASVPAFLQILGSLSGILTKAEAHCKAKNIQPDVLLGARLYPDMLPLSKQIQLASDFAAKGCARLTHSEVPSTPDTEKTFEELKQRLAKTIEYVKSFKPTQFEGADTREVTFPVGPNTMTLKGQQFLSGFAFPNFYFHAATTHGIFSWGVSSFLSFRGAYLREPGIHDHDREYGFRACASTMCNCTSGNDDGEFELRNQGPRSHIIVGPPAHRLGGRPCCAGSDFE